MSVLQEEKVELQLGHGISWWRECTPEVLLVFESREGLWRSELIMDPATGMLASRTRHHPRHGWSYGWPAFDIEAYVRIRELDGWEVVG